jgi:hypothetical protein
MVRAIIPIHEGKWTTQSPAPHMALSSSFLFAFTEFVLALFVVLLGLEAEFA